MDSSLWLVIAIIALGTYFMRLLPYLWMSKRLSRHKDDNLRQHTPSWVSMLGPVMIAAMFGVSLVPAQPSPIHWVATAIGSLLTWLTWLKTRTLGMPILVGVLVYGLTVVVLR